MIGATNEKPRLGKQPGFSSLHLQGLILPNPAASQRACGDDTQSQKPPPAMMLKAKAAFGDDDDSPSHTGLCSDFYVFKWALSYLMRSLLSEGRISYDTVEVTEVGIKPKHIEREGPTGLITTTTENSLHPENETRYFSVEVDDTPNQTSRVLLATAENINTDNWGDGEEEIGSFSPSKSGLREAITKL